MVPKAHRPRTLLNERPRWLLPQHHSHPSLPPSHTCPPRPLSVFPPPRAKRLAALAPERRGTFPRKAPQLGPPSPGQGRTPLSHPGRLKKEKSQIHPPSPHQPELKGGRGGGTQGKNFLLRSFSQRVKGVEGTPPSPGAEGAGGGEPPPNRLTAGRGRGTLEVEGAWDGEAGLGARSRSCRGSWGRGAAGVPPTWHTKRLPRSALTRSFVFSIRASWVGVVRAPRARGAPSPSWGQAPLPGTTATTGGSPLGPDRRRRRQPPDFPPLTRVAPGYQQH